MPAALSTPDVIVLLVCAVVAVRGAWKGFAWQIVRTVGLIAAIAGALLWHRDAGAWLEERVGILSDATAPIVAFVVIGLGILLLATWLAWVARGALRSVKLGGLDRFLGFLAGAVMGLVLATAGFLAWGAFVQEDTLRETLEDTVSGRFMAKVVRLTRPVLPEFLEGPFGSALDTLDRMAEQENAPEAAPESE
jgi:uncharacterized membrane protein required for colicin V production